MSVFIQITSRQSITNLDLYYCWEFWISLRLVFFYHKLAENISQKLETWIFVLLHSLLSAFHLSPCPRCLDPAVLLEVTLGWSGWFCSGVVTAFQCCHSTYKSEAVWLYFQSNFLFCPSWFPSQSRGGDIPLLSLSWSPKGSEHVSCQILWQLRDSCRELM